MPNTFTAALFNTFFLCIHANCLFSCSVSCSCAGEKEGFGQAEWECGTNEWENEAITNKLSDFKVEQTTF